VQKTNYTNGAFGFANTKAKAKKNQKIHFLHRMTN